MSIEQSRPCESWVNRLWRRIAGTGESRDLVSQSSCKSVTGGRKENQDRCYSSDKASLYMVVDGMGGHVGGGLASQIAIETIPQELTQAFVSGAYDTDSLQKALRDSLRNAQREMLLAVNQNESYRKMGCTLAIAAIVGDRLVFTNVGDTRVYLYRNQHLHCLTTDESLVQQLLDAGILSAEQAKHHRWRHIVTNYLTTSGVQHRPQWSHVDLAVGDTVLLASDGLHDALAEDEVANILRRHAEPAACVQSLIRASLSAKAKDNVTCVVVKIDHRKNGHCDNSTVICAGE